MNRSSYKAQDVKKATVHSFMKIPIAHVPSSYMFDPSQLGFSVPYLHSNIPYLIHEKQVIIDSLDRDVAVYKNPYDMVVQVDPLIKTVKYISIDNIVLPYVYELVCEVLDASIYASLVSALDASMNTLAIDDDVTVAGRNIQICNLVRNGTDWDINYTENKVPTTVFRITKGVTTIMVKYTYGTKYISNKLVLLQIDQMEPRFLSTSTLQTKAIQLYPKKIIADSLSFKIKNDSVVLKNHDIINISKLNIKCIDEDGNLLQIPNLDEVTVTDKYSTNPYSSPKYYIRHPLHSKWQVHLVFKFGTIEPFLQKHFF
jgi:hypothetical protein